MASLGSQIRVADAADGFDIEAVRADFPILRKMVHGKPLVYLDNAATTQKPESVITALTNYYSGQNANIHRGVHHLSQLATTLHDGARETVREFVNAKKSSEIVFVRGTTEAINLVAHSFGSTLVPGDEVLITGMEHHSNIVPWQMLAENRGITVRVVPLTDAGELDMGAFRGLLSQKTKLVSVVHTSNALGTVNPVGEIVSLARKVGALTLLDGAQTAAHAPIDVQALGCDFYCLSGHKLYGPTGIGVLYGREDLLNSLPPYQGGGDMIRSVTFERAIYNDAPYRFEAGTPDIAGAIGLAAAIDYVKSIGFEAIGRHEDRLLSYASEQLSRVPGLRFIGTARHRAGAISFVLDGVHPHDIGTILDQEGVAVRTGHHCAQPVMKRFGVPATTRASFAIYNTLAEIDALVAGLGKVREIFG